ncbi:MAG: glycosyltransferase [Muribaculaceae bacterium]|nr:glycosyltransferase [Muribaculaceae bacterium]
MNKKRLSIIIPAYNVEQYIGRCLESCLNQDLAPKDYEIIVVNDGTPDKSMEVVDLYAKSHDNIISVNRKNGGLSAARNTGLEYATGEYVWFVDSDDRIEANCLGYLLNFAGDNRLDVLCFGLFLEYADGRTSLFPINNKGGEVYKGCDFLNRVAMPPAAWAALYKRSFLNSRYLRFLEGILHEDQEFTPRAYYLSERIAFINIPFYYYCQREGSIMKSSRDARRCRDLLKVADSLYYFAETEVDRGSEAWNTFLQKVYFCVTQSLAFYSSDVFELGEYKKREYYPFNLSVVKGTIKHKLCLANYSLRLYVMLHRLLKK